MISLYGEVGAAGESNVDLLRYPSISPDGACIVFSWRGDLWKVNANGGMALRLTAHPGNELRSAWHRDGKRIAFESDRNGFQNLYIMNNDGTGIRQITDTDQACSLTGFGIDENGNEVLTFSSNGEGDLYRSPRPFMISVNGGDIRRVHDAFGDHPVVSPDGKRVAFTRGGSRWSRRGYRGSDNRNVWLYDRTDQLFKQLTDWEGNDGKAKWKDNETLFFLSDRNSNCVNLFCIDLIQPLKEPTPCTFFTEHDIQDFDISADGKTAVLLMWNTLYTINLYSPDAAPAPISIHASDDDSDKYQIKTINREVTEAALSPDGKVMAFVAYGEIYVRNIEEKSPTRRVTNSHAREKQIAWSPDGLKLYFVSDQTGSDSIFCATVALSRGEVKKEFDVLINPSSEEKIEVEKESDSKKEEKSDQDNDTEKKDKDEADEEEEDADLPKELNHKRWHDAVQFHITPVIDEETNDRMPRPSPDRKSLAFRRGRGDLMILDLENGKIRALISGWDTEIDWRWSPDSRFIAYHQNDRNFNSDIWIVPADGSEKPVNISRHPNNDLNPRWSADGKILSFISERINDEFDVWMVYLDKHLESLTPIELEAYYKDAAESAKKRKPLKINPANQETDEEKNKSEEKETIEKSAKLDLDDAYLRLRRVTTLLGNEWNNEMTPAGDRLVFTGRSGESGLFSIKWDGEDLKRLTDSAEVQHLTLSGDKIIFVANGRAGMVGPTETKTESIDIEDQIQIDLEQQTSQKFHEAARILGEVFYHPTIKDLDWKAVTENYYTLVKNTRSADEFNYVAALLLGELNASHLGINAPDPRESSSQPQGRLGILHRRMENGFEILEVIPESPAAKKPMNLQVGDVIMAMDGRSFGPFDTIESSLEGRIGKETLLTVQRKIESGERKTIQLLLTPIRWSDERQLKYEAWRQNNARQVEEWSNGRIGYIHIQAMNQSSLDVFERDLYAVAGDKEGLLIDVRNNGGGSTTDRVLASIMVQPHAYTVPRGADPNFKTGYPQDRLFIQRYSLPINMLCNEKSFSNAEIISHAFKTLKRGTLVGQETHGAVITTGATRLIDGTTVRLPYRGWYLLDDTDMENHGAVPDILVPQTPEAESRNLDEQLRAAVDDLLKRLP